MAKKIKIFLDNILYGMSCGADIWGHDAFNSAQRLVALGGLYRDGRNLAADCRRAFAKAVPQKQISIR